MCERTDGNVIDAGFSEVSDGLERNSAGGFQRNTSSHDLYRFPRIRGSEVVEENHVGSCRQRFLKLIKIAHFDFNFDEMPEAAAGMLNRVPNGWMKGQMVVLDQD